MVESIFGWAEYESLIDPRNDRAPISYGEKLSDAKTNYLKLLNMHIDKEGDIEFLDIETNTKSEGGVILSLDKITWMMFDGTWSFRHIIQRDNDPNQRNPEKTTFHGIYDETLGIIGLEVVHVGTVVEPNSDIYYNPEFFAMINYSAENVISEENMYGDNRTVPTNNEPHSPRGIVYIPEKDELREDGLIGHDDECTTNR